MSGAGGASQGLAEASGYARREWEASILPTLTEYIRIPCVSPLAERGWESLGHMEQAVQLLRGWAEARAIPGLTVEVHRLPGRTPVLLAEIPPANGGPADDTVLLYGHLDKQPEMVGWRDGLGPWEPARDADRLYGRGGADDGYALFASLVAIEAAQAAGFPHARCVVLIEASEESGSIDLPAHVEALAHRIGSPSLVICLDSGALDYDRMWVTTSLRGLAAGRLTVNVLSEGVHSGDAGGVVPSTFRIARHLLSRIEDEASGRVLVPEAHVPIPPDRVEEAGQMVALLPGPVADVFPFLPGVRAQVDDRVAQALARTWEPQVEIIGADGLPETARAGNVLRPTTTLGVSMRLPPTASAAAVTEALSWVLTTNPPHGARVTFDAEDGANGWNAPSFEPWLWRSLDEASHATFGQPAAAMGEGGTIPFMGMLSARFPDAQFAVTGVLGPQSNAHGPNEFLHVPTGIRLTTAMALVLRDHATRR